MIVVKMELWPHGTEDESKHTLLGMMIITNDGTGSGKVGNYQYTISHAGIHFGKRKEPFKRGRVVGFVRTLSPYRLIQRILKDAKET